MSLGLKGRNLRWPTAAAAAPFSRADVALEVGLFFVEWCHSSGPSEGTEAGWVRVRHARCPERSLFETRPGEAFVRVARGQAHVREARGFFHIEERAERETDGQTVERFEREGQDAVLSGQLLGPLETGWRLRFSAIDDAQLAIRLELEGGEAALVNRVRLALARAAGARVFGFGAQFTHLDMNGRRVPVLSQEPGIGRGVQPLTFVMNALFGAGGAWHNSNAPVPHYLTTALESFFLEGSEYSVFDFTVRGRTEIEVHASQLSGRILFGETPLDLIEAYTRHAGRMPPLPAWLESGAVIGMQGGAESVEQMLTRLERHQAPVSAFWLQDWVGGRRTAIGKQLWWNWEVCRETYPDWEGLVAKLRARGIRVLSYVNPFLVDPGEEKQVGRNLHREALEAGYFVRDREGRPYSILNTSFSANLLDLTHPGARRWMKDVIRDQLLESGASGWMADFGEALPFDAVLYDGTDAGAYHNRYPVEWARLNREAIREAGREGDVVFFTRSGFTESPRESTLFWLGDQLTSWRREDGLQSAIIALLSSGFSGFSLNHSDVGGYTTTAVPSIPFDIPLLTFTREKELLLRWIELNAFTAVFRTHEGNRPDRNHQIDDDEETTAHFARFARVYAALASYRAGLGRESARRGHPVARHPWLHFPDDAQAEGLELQFMLGPDFMIAPVVVPGETRVDVYLPAGRWTHLWTEQEIDSRGGAWFRAHAPIGAPAVFFRAGSAAGGRLVATLDAQGDMRRDVAHVIPRPEPAPGSGRPGARALGPSGRTAARVPILRRLAAALSGWAGRMNWSGVEIDPPRRVDEKRPRERELVIPDQ